MPADVDVELDSATRTGGRLAGGAATASPTDGVDRVAHGRPSARRAALSWGAGWPPNGLARDLRPDEVRGLDLHHASRSTSRCRSSACPRSSCSLVGVDAGRDLRGAPVGGGARRRRRRSSPRRPQPDPPTVRLGPAADAGPTTARGGAGPDPAADDGLPVRGRQPHPADRPDRATGRRCGRRRCPGSCACIAARPPRPAWSCRCSPTTPRLLEPPAFKPSTPRRPARGGHVRRRTSPDWRIEEDVLAGP